MHPTTTPYRQVLAIFVGMLLLVGCADSSNGAAASSTDLDTSSIVVDDARARMSPRMAGVAAAYMTLTNVADTDDRLIAASVPAHIAGRIEIHETIQVNGGGMPHGSANSMDGSGSGHGAPNDAPMMGMREIGGIDLPAGVTVNLEPGGLHLMLMELVDDLSPGATFELELQFEHADPMTVTVEVREQV